MSAAAGKQSEAARYLSFAETLLGRGDLVGSKRFAENALESDPLLPGVDQILAVSDVLLAAQQHHMNNQPNWYSLLQLDPSSAPDLTAVKRHYRRLALLLRPDSNKSPGAADAFKLVVNAFAILSDPAKKSLFDAELNIAVAADPFWTTCPACLHVYQYPRPYQNRLLRCTTCHRPFRATEAPAPPPLVPTTTTTRSTTTTMYYYSSWGFFPLGYAGSGAPSSACLPDHTDGWKKPFHHSTSWWKPQQPAPAPNAPTVTPTSPPPKSKKKTARKSVRNSAGKNPSPAQTEAQPVPISTAPPPPPNPKWGEPEKKPAVVPEPISPVPLAWEAPAETNTTTDQGGEGGVKVINNKTPMEADAEGNTITNDSTPMEADAPTSELLGNLQSTPVLKDEEIQNETPNK